MDKLITGSFYTVKGKPCIGIHLKQNNLSFETHDQVVKHFKGKEVEVHGNPYKVIGVEQYATHFVHDDVGLMLEKITPWK